MQKKQWMLYKVRISEERLFLLNGARKVVDSNLETATEIIEVEDIVEVTVEREGSTRAEEVLLMEGKAGLNQETEIVEEEIIGEVIVMRDNRGEGVGGLGLIRIIIIIIIVILIIEGQIIIRVEGGIIGEIALVILVGLVNNSRIIRGILNYHYSNRELV
jgi:hypothetical protein